VLLCLGLLLCRGLLTATPERSKVSPRIAHRLPFSPLRPEEFRPHGTLPNQSPEVIETERFWEQKLDYLHENPCRKGLVARAEHWRFSSAGYWLSDGKAASQVALGAIQW